MTLGLATCYSSLQHSSRDTKASGRAGYPSSNTQLSHGRSARHVHISMADRLAAFELADGSLRMSAELPLLWGRYRALSIIGEVCTMFSSQRLWCHLSTIAYRIAQGHATICVLCIH